MLGLNKSISIPTTYKFNSRGDRTSPSNEAKEKSNRRFVFASAYVCDEKRNAVGEMNGRYNTHGTILHYTILYYTILHYTTLYYTILHYTTLLYIDAKQKGRGIGGIGEGYRGGV